MKVATPRIPSDPTDARMLDLIEDNELDNAEIIDQDGVGLALPRLQMDSVIFDKVQLTAAQFEHLNARDVVVKRSELSSSSFSNSSMNRVSFDNCRMTGGDLSRSTLHDITFRGCKLDMANFRFADLRRVHFIECSFVESDFLSATLYDVRFESCVLEKTVFEQAKCRQVDLRSSDLYEISGWSSLRGAVIDGVQLASVAPYLAQELGISIRS